jgi:hypothetical protein
MSYYSKKEFLEQVNISPLFKSFKKKPDEKFLKKLKFSEENYTPHGLITLRDLFVTCLDRKNNKQAQKNKNTTKIPDKLFKAYWAFTEKVNNCFKLIASGKRKGLSLLTILSLTPEFEKRITEIRTKYNINPQEFKKGIYSLFPDNERPLVSNELESDDNLMNLPWKDYSKEEFDRTVGILGDVRAKIIVTINKKFPLFNNDIASFRNRYGLVPIYDNYLKDLILFEKINSGDTLPIKGKRHYTEKTECEFNRFPEEAITNAFEKTKSFRPHISINIYGSTPIDNVYDKVKILYGFHSKLGKDNKNFLKNLPSHKFKKTIPDLKYEVILRKAMLYFFHEVQHLSSQEVIALCGYLGVSTNKKNILRDIRAFKGYFNI